jgi:hypothetical protein
MSKNPIEFKVALTKHQSDVSVNTSVPERYDNDNGCYMLYQVWPPSYDIQALYTLIKEVWPESSMETTEKPTGTFTTIFKTDLSGLNIHHWSVNGSLGFYGRAGSTKNSIIALTR